MADKPENTPAEELGAAVVESEAPSGAEAYFEKNKTKIVALVCLVIIGAAAFIILSNVSKQKNLEAANAFTNAQTAEQYRQVSIDYQGTVAGGNALLMKADLETKEQNRQAATATITDFVSSYQSHPRYAQGLFALAEFAQDDGNLDEAKRRFQEIVDTQSATEFAPLALMRVGDIAAANKNYEEARGIYTSIPGRFPANPFIQKVAQKIELLNLVSPPPDLKKQEPTAAGPAAPQTEPAPAPAKDAAPKQDSKTTPQDQDSPGPAKPEANPPSKDTKEKAAPKKTKQAADKDAPKDSPAPKKKANDAPPPAEGE
ncbi:MAG: tetratricopeptide repeat protein [Verrucomicrobiota bacterium]